jgi:hypothetical protein
MQRNGTAYISGERLIAAEYYDQGTAYWWQQQAVAYGFDTTFTFYNGRSGSADGNYRAGFAFIVQNEGSAALGTGSDSGLGYSGIPNSIVVEFDNYNTSPAANHMSIQTRGLDPNSADTTYSLGWTSAIPAMANQTHTARITYDGQRLKVYVNPDVFTDPWLDVAVDLGTLLNLNQGKAWVGFTGGSNRGFMAIDDWQFTSSGAPPEPPVISSFGSNGSLTWSHAVTGGFHSVQWASSITGTWHHSWADLVNHAATGGTTTVSVPMYYRVIWTASEVSQ